ncbi:MAG: DUF3795 domain-containing protein [Candidatus Heimdallarchaeota archaeon]|nr:MAG: DUF3795 domain-containing protein [Candidatus Heimdallarchaeota archaeon]
MNINISLCGFNCGICPAFKPNIKSEKDRLKVDEGWKKFHKTQGWVYKEDYCHGCFNVPETPLWSGCPIRKCVLTNNVENCGYCPDYPCPRIKNMIHITKKIAERTKKEGTQEDYQKFGAPFLSESKLEELHKEFKKKRQDIDTQPLNTHTVEFPQNINQEYASQPEILQDLHSTLKNILSLHCKTPGGKEQELKRNKDVLKFLWIFGRYGNLKNDTDQPLIEITPKELKKYLKYGKWRTKRKLEELARYGIDGHYSQDKVSIRFTKKFQLAYLLQKYVQTLLENNKERSAYSKFWKADMNIFRK